VLQYVSYKILVFTHLSYLILKFEAEFVIECEFHQLLSKVYVQEQYVMFFFKS